MWDITRLSCLTDLCVSEAQRRGMYTHTRLNLCQILPEDDSETPDRDRTYSVTREKINQCLFFFLFFEILKKKKRRNVELQKK